MTSVLFQVGDVILVQDESVIDNEFKMIGLETLVCFTILKDSNLWITFFYMIYLSSLSGTIWIRSCLCALHGTQTLDVAEAVQIKI